MKPYYRTSEQEDVYELAPKLRKQDVDEVKASSGYTPEEALIYSFHVSGENNTIIAPDGEIIGMFGVGSTADPYIGVPWLLASPRLPEITREFLPQSLEWVKQKNEQYPVLINYVDCRNTVAIRWLRYLGFTFIKKIEEYGVGKKPFYEFVRIHNV
jgi:RimJ/RimL family protein N-acetyltransferase